MHPSTQPCTSPQKRRVVPWGELPHLLAFSPRSGLRLSSLVMGGVIVSVLAGLYATDRVLTQASRERLRLDAAESATLIESYLAQRADALMALRAVYVEGSGGRRRRGESSHRAV